MPLAVVAGIPQAVYQRARTKPVRTGWEIRVIPGNQGRRADLRSVWTRVMKVADQALADGVHLILSHDTDNERRKFLELKSRSYRAIWLPRALSKEYGQPAFNVAIDDILAFEDCWRARIRPGRSSPLLLPETAFSAQPSVSNVWDRARTVDRTRDSLDAIENALTQFRREHWMRTRWRDKNRLEFTIGTAWQPWAEALAEQEAHVPAYFRISFRCQISPGSSLQCFRLAWGTAYVRSVYEH